MPPPNYRENPSPKQIPSGGTAGQILTKKSNENWDAEWRDPGEGSVGPQGEPGEQGPQGIQGIQGPAGEVGESGATGATGDTGPTGETGTKGDDGDPAASWPIGSVFISVVSTNPATLLGFGTWAAFAAGRVLVGLDAGQTEFDTVEETGGEKTHTLTASEMPVHTHVQNSHNHTQDAHQHGMAEGTTDGSGTFMDRSNAAAATTAVTDMATATNQAATAVNQNAGGDAAHNNLQPYITVYMWKRTA